MIFESNSKYFFELTLEGKEKWSCTSFDPNNLPQPSIYSELKVALSSLKAQRLKSQDQYHVSFNSNSLHFQCSVICPVRLDHSGKASALFTARDFGAPVSRVNIPSASSWPLERSGYHVPTALAWINTCAHLSSVNIILFPIPFSFFHLFSGAQGTSHPFLWHLLSNLIFLTTLACDTPSILLTSHQAAPIFQRRAKLNHRDKEATHSQKQNNEKTYAICDRRQVRGCALREECGLRIRQLFYFHICHFLSVTFGFPESHLQKRGNATHI